MTSLSLNEIDIITFGVLVNDRKVTANFSSLPNYAIGQVHDLLVYGCCEDLVDFVNIGVDYYAAVEVALHLLAVGFSHHSVFNCLAAVGREEYMILLGLFNVCKITSSLGIGQIRQSNCYVTHYWNL